MAITVINGPIIEAGKSLSDGVDVSVGSLVRITTPAAWTSANLTFQVSSDGNGYNDLYTVEGREVMIPCGPSRAILVDEGLLKWVNFLKIRSGSAANPVAQEERREFAIAVSAPDEAPAAAAVRTPSRGR